MRMKKFLEKLGYKVKNESGKVETKAIYVLFWGSVLYAICSLINFGFNCFGKINATIVCGFFINIAVWIRIVTLEYIQMKDIKNAMIPSDVIGSDEILVYATKVKTNGYFRIALIIMLAVLIMALLFASGTLPPDLKGKVLWLLLWITRGIQLSTIIVSFLQQFVEFLEKKYKAYMGLYQRVEKVRSVT